VPLGIFGVELTAELILAIAALVTAIAGLLTALAAWRRHGRTVAKTAEEECFERLRVARAEAEELALEVHTRRMREALE
jgi:hypothetical protein